MGKIKNMSIKRSMTITFIITVCLVGVLCGITIFWANHSQQEIAAAIYYRVKLRVPISQLQNGMRRIQDNDLDFSIKYSGDDELGKLCSSMEKMRKELCHNNKTLWETLQQRRKC